MSFGAFTVTTTASNILDTQSWTSCLLQNVGTEDVYLRVTRDIAEVTPGNGLVLAAGSQVSFGSGSIGGKGVIRAVTSSGSSEVRYAAD